MAAPPDGADIRRLASEVVYRSEEHTSEHQSPCNLVCRLLLEKTKDQRDRRMATRHATRAATLAGRGGRRWEGRRHRRAGWSGSSAYLLRFFFNDTATTEIYTLSLHDALPICWLSRKKLVSLIVIASAIDRYSQ